MQKPRFGRALSAGFIAWIAFNLVMAMAPLMGVDMNVPAMLGGMFGMNSLAMGWVLHLMIGLILGLIYAYGLASHLPGAPWVRGLLYGILPWLAMMVVVAPMLPLVSPSMSKMPPGFFLANMGMIAPVGGLIAHLVFGAVLGAMYGAADVAHGDAPRLA